MNRNETGKISSIYGIIMSCIAILIIFTLGIPTYMIHDEIKVPVSTFGVLLIAMMVLMVLQLLPNMTLSYFDYKRRKAYPIEDGENQK